MYQKILVPVEIGNRELAKRILDLGVGLLAEGGSIKLLHVVPELPVYGEAYVSHDLFEENTKVATDFLSELAGGVDATVNTKVKAGAASHAILDQAGEMEADLIIIGSHKPGLSDYLLGSTAARVVRHAKCSVLVDR